MPQFPPTRLLAVCDDFLIFPRMTRSIHQVVIWRGCLCQATKRACYSFPSAAKANCLTVTLSRGVFPVTLLEQVLLQGNLPYLSRKIAADFRRYLLLKERKNVNVPVRHRTMQGIQRRKFSKDKF